MYCEGGVPCCRTEWAVAAPQLTHELGILLADEQSVNETFVRVILGLAVLLGCIGHSSHLAETATALIWYDMADMGSPIVYHLTSAKLRAVSDPMAYFKLPKRYDASMYLALGKAMYARLPDTITSTIASEIAAQQQQESVFELRGWEPSRTHFERQVLADKYPRLAWWSGNRADPLTPAAFTTALEAIVILLGNARESAAIKLVLALDILQRDMPLLRVYVTRLWVRIAAWILMEREDSYDMALVSEPGNLVQLYLDATDVGNDRYRSAILRVVIETIPREVLVDMRAALDSIDRGVFYPPLKHA